MSPGSSDKPASAAPLYRVPETAETGVRAGMRGEKRDAIAEGAAAIAERLLTPRPAPRRD